MSLRVYEGDELVPWDIILPSLLPQLAGAAVVLWAWQRGLFVSGKELDRERAEWKQREVQLVARAEAAESAHIELLKETITEQRDRDRTLETVANLAKSSKGEKG